MERDTVQGWLLEQFAGPYLYARPNYDNFEDSVVCERLNSEGYVVGNYIIVSVDDIERKLGDEYTKIGEYASLSEARDAVASR